MIFHVMISASLVEGTTHHFCFFAFFRLTVLPPSSCHWLFAESIPIAACIHFHIARKWPGSKSRFLRCGGFLKQGCPKSSIFRGFSIPNHPAIPTETPDPCHFDPKNWPRRYEPADESGLAPWRKFPDTFCGSEQVEWPWIPYESKGLVWLSL